LTIYAYCKTGTLKKGKSASTPAQNNVVSKQLVPSSNLTSKLVGIKRFVRRMSLKGKQFL
jgi:hypothetical protein